MRTVSDVSARSGGCLNRPAVFMPASPTKVRKSESSDMLMAMRTIRPTIAITIDNRDDTLASDQYLLRGTYVRAVTQAGGLACLLTQEIDAIEPYLDLADAVLFTGGSDLRPELLPPTSPLRRQPIHPACRFIAPERQRFEWALLTALQSRPEIPVLGVCMGFQLMSLFHGGDMHQHLPDHLGEAAAKRHQDNHRHAIELLANDSGLPAAGAGESADESVVSYHHQAISSVGSLRLIARSPDGVPEAADDPKKPFYLGVQWHPERGGAGRFNADLIRALVQAAGRWRTRKSARSG